MLSLMAAMSHPVPFLPSRYLQGEAGVQASKGNTGTQVPSNRLWGMLVPPVGPHQRHGSN
jgi:hypothetical protein